MQRGAGVYPKLAPQLKQSRGCAYVYAVIEILDHLDVLTQPALDPGTLSLAGVPFGSRAADAIARDRITEALSPIVHRTIGVHDGDSKYHYYGSDGRRLSPDEVIDSVINADGMLHFAEMISYKIASGAVVGFALYGTDRGCLAHFGFLRSYEQFLATFGAPDRVEEHQAFGDLLGYRNYYWHSRKSAYWSLRDEGGEGQLSLINLGDYEGNTGRR